MWAFPVLFATLHQINSSLSNTFFLCIRMFSFLTCPIIIQDPIPDTNTPERFTSFPLNPNSEKKIYTSIHAGIHRPSGAAIPRRLRSSSTSLSPALSLSPGRGGEFCICPDIAIPQTMRIMIRTLIFTFLSLSHLKGEWNTFVGRRYSSDPEVPSLDTRWGRRGSE